jgi:hypothetical protein
VTTPAGTSAISPTSRFTYEVHGRLWPYDQRPGPGDTGVWTGGVCGGIGQVERSLDDSIRAANPLFALCS